MYQIFCECGHFAIADGIGLSEAMTELHNLGYVITYFKRVI